jgi:hypothetical protein
MASDYLPGKDGALLTWAQNASTLITATPTAFGLTAGIATAFSGVVSTYATAYAAAANPITRTQGTVSTKNTARTALKTNIRGWAKIVQATATVTPAQKIDLGLNPHDTNPSPINPPTDAPVVEVVSVFGRTVTLKLHGTGTDRRGKPAGVAGASIFTHTGATPPANLAEWDYQGGTTRTSFDVQFAPEVAAGSQVWICGLWFNPRNQNGPACDPISTYIAGGVAVAA